MKSIRNVAIIAHVDHGKTTLVDKIIHESKLIDDRKDAGELILDSNDLERERGITILSKNVSVNYKGTKINLIDTPGHADFGGEVERVLKMADGVLLLVDAFEGPMPQTRFVLGKAIELGLKPIVVVNKVDKDNCKPDEVNEDVFDLMYNLNANEDQLDYVTIFGSSKQGWMGPDWKTPTDNVRFLLDTIIEQIPPPPVREGGLQLQITSLDYSNFVGRIAIGRVYRGTIREGEDFLLFQKDGKEKKVRIKELYVFEGLGRERIKEVNSGDICAVVGLDDFEIGDTICDIENPMPMKRIAVDEPTMSMVFTINTSPFFGKEGKYVTSRHLRDRLYMETKKNLALRIEETDREDTFRVYGRGVMHLSVLIETMRREGYEFQVGKPHVLFKEENGKRYEPYEVLVVDVPDEFSGKVIEIATLRKGELKVMNPKGDLQHLEFEIPSRGIIGLRNKILTLTGGTAIMNHSFLKYDEFKEGIPDRNKGSLVSINEGQVLAFALDRLQDRGRFFIAPGDKVYIGMVVGEYTRNMDLGVNVTKAKKLTNMRASGTDENVKIAPKVVFSLEESLEYIKEDEYLEVTPESLRMRKITFKP
ncbi:MAG TPA: translational GTPase TypA [Bacteroidetes bacterium]|nr:translational GTPase TypA [Bacteroidota bacterium]